MGTSKRLWVQVSGLSVNCNLFTARSGGLYNIGGLMAGRRAASYGYQQTEGLSGAEYLASIYGTEKDKVNCSFYFKVSVFIHHDNCHLLES